MAPIDGNSFSGVRVGLAVVCVAQFVVVLDATIVATALPTVAADLHFRPAQLGWVITAYTVVLAGLLILGGRLSDVLGARRIFTIGLLGFVAASLACALAASPAALVGARVVQGAAAALLSPAALAALNQLVGSRQARHRALGWWTAAAAGGGASGWVLGGVLVQFAGWRWIFAINAPIGITALLMSCRALAGVPRPCSATTSQALDLPGAALVTSGIALAAWGMSRLTEAPTAWAGWTAVGTAVVVLAGFALYEGRTPHPLLRPRLLRTGGILGGNLTAAALTASTTPAMLTVVLYVHDTLGLAPAVGAALFPAFNLAVIAGSLLGPRLVTRTGTRVVLLTGFAGIFAGISVLFALPRHGLPVTLLLSAFVVMGAGLGAASVASTTAGTSEVPPADQGVAAGLLNSTAQLGTALGLAVTTPLVMTTSPMTGYHLGFTVAAVIAVAGAVSTLTLPHARSRRQTVSSGRPSESSARRD